MKTYEEFFWNSNSIDYEEKYRAHTATVFGRDNYLRTVKECFDVIKGNKNDLNRKINSSNRHFGWGGNTNSGIYMEYSMGWRKVNFIYTKKIIGTVPYKVMLTSLIFENIENLLDFLNDCGVKLPFETNFLMAIDFVRKNKRFDGFVEHIVNEYGELYEYFKKIHPEYEDVYDQVSDYLYKNYDKHKDEDPFGEENWIGENLSNNKKIVYYTQNYIDKEKVQKLMRILKHDWKNFLEKNPVAFETHKGKLYLTEGHHRFEACLKLNNKDIMDELFRTAIYYDITWKPASFKKIIIKG